MDPHRWQQIEQLYYLALEQETPSERLPDSCVSRRCGLLREVESLLEQSDSTEALVDRNAWAAAAQDLGPTQMLLKAHEMLGPYEILAPIGSGGMGEVWKAGTRA